MLAVVTVLVVIVVISLPACVAVNASEADIIRPVMRNGHLHYSGPLISLYPPRPEEGKYIMDTRFVELIEKMRTTSREVDRVVLGLRNPFDVKRRDETNELGKHHTSVTAAFAIDSGAFMNFLSPVDAEVVHLLPGGTCSFSTPSGSTARGFTTVALVGHLSDGPAFPRNITFCVSEQVHQNLLGLPFMHEMGWSHVPGVGLKPYMECDVEPAADGETMVPRKHAGLALFPIPK